MQVGTPYTFSLDIGRVSTTGAQYSGACYVYVYHDSLTTNNLITSSVGVVTTTGTIQWKTYSGTYTPTASSFEFGVYVACPYVYYAVKSYMDNVVVTGKVVPSCPPCWKSTCFCLSCPLSFCLVCSQAENGSRHVRHFKHILMSLGN